MSNDESDFHSLDLDPDRECPINLVTVFNDRAEVNRLINKQLTQAGTYELKVRNLPSIVDRNSVHVSGGTGNAVILEVSTELKYGESVEQSSARTMQENKKAELDETERRIRVEERNLVTLTKSVGWLEAWSRSILLLRNPSSPSPHTSSDSSSAPSSSVSTPLASPRPEPQSPCTPPEASSSSSSSSSSSEAFSPKRLKQVSNFLEFYEQETTKLDKRIFELEELLTKLRNQHRVLTEELNTISPSLNHQLKSSLEVAILLQVNADTPLHLSLVYVLPQASWSPSYDLRAQATNNEAVLTYYGSIVNTTGEDWKDVQMSLSTAMPSVGGSPPELKTLRVETEKPISWGTPKKLKAKKEKEKEEKKEEKKDTKRRLRARHAEDDDEDNEEEIKPDCLERIVSTSVLTSTVSEGLSNETFQIQRRTKIPSDGKPHKVTIGVVTLADTRQTHVAVPKLTPHVYLKASAVNNSAYRFLPGPLDIFLDSNFVALSSLRNVQPKESFSFFLGVDGGVRLEYVPQTHKKREEGGGWLLGGTKMKIEKVEKRVTVKNTRERDINILVIDQLPLSSEDKVKVTLIQPEWKRVDKGEKNEKGEKEKAEPEHGSVKLNAQNCLEWRVKITAGESITIPYEYHLEWPADTEVFLLED